MGTPPRPLSSIERLREWRGVREKTSTLDQTVRAQAEHLTRRMTDYERATAAYWSAVPPALKAAGAPVSLGRGTLVVACPNAAARHRLSQWLRGAGARELTRAGVSDVKVTLAR